MKYWQDLYDTGKNKGKNKNKGLRQQRTEKKRDLARATWGVFFPVGGCGRRAGTPGGGTVSTARPGLCANPKGAHAGRDASADGFGIIRTTSCKGEKRIFS